MIREIRKTREVRMPSAEEFRKELDRRIADTMTRFYVPTEYAGVFKTLFSTLVTLYYLEGSLKSHTSRLKPKTNEIFEGLHDIVGSMLLPLLQAMRELCGQFMSAAEFADEVEALRLFCGARLYPL